MILGKLEKEAGMGTGALNLGKDLIHAAKGAVPMGMKNSGHALNSGPSFTEKASHLIKQHGKTNPKTSKALRYGGTGLAAVGADRALSRRDN